jgi:hypothetical protein
MPFGRSPAPPPPEPAGFAALAQAFLSTVFMGPTGEASDQKILGMGDVHIYLLSAAICFVLQWVINYAVIYPLFRWALPDTKNKSKMVIKAGVSATELWIYTFFTLAGYRICFTQEWIWPSRLWWEGKPFSDAHYWVTPSFKFMYLLYGGRYLAHLVSVLIEPKKKDFWQMALHHASTTVLVFLSYCLGYSRIGAAVMFLLDPADPPLHIAKLCLYMAGGKGKGESRWQFLADRFFEIFGVLFFVTRCCLYPYCVWSATIEGPRYVFNAGKPEAWFDMYLFDELVAVCLLWVLMFLQFFWLSLIIKVALKPHAEDNRSDSEGEEDDDEGRPKASIAKKKVP